MSGGGKSQTSTSSVSIPPEILARYNAVNTRAEATGQIPFQPYTGEFVAPLSQTQQAGIANINQAAGMAQPYYQAAGSAITGGAAQAQPYYQAATNQIYGGLAAAQPLQQASIANQLAGQAAGTQALQGAFGASQPVMQGALTGLSNIPVQSLPLQQQALLGISQAQASADPYQQASFGSLMQAGTQAQPYTREASQALSRGEFAAQPMQQMAGQGISAAQAAGAPYQQLATQYGLAGAQRIDPNALNVQRYMSPYIESVAQPTLKALQQQQQQEQQKIVGDQIRSGAFGGDRGRIAQAVLAQQQGLATGQAMGNIYQQGYGQALSTAQQQQQTALAAEQANRAAQQAAAQQMLGIGQQGFGQEMTAAQQRAALGQQMFGQGVAGAQQRAALGQQVFGQGAQTAQQQAALAQQLYGQGLSGAQAQQGVAQQMINQGLGIAGQQAGIGQNLFGQGAQAAQQLYGMGAGTAQQQAALAQQQYAQQMGAAQQLQGLGQGLFGIGSGVSQGLTGIGGAAQQAALQGGQAQLGAGTVEQQTQQALNQANYNQFLQQQGYPYQVAQFLANVAMGTGALSGSTTTTTQPASFFSDERLKEGVEPIGKTFDGQQIVRFKYKGEPGTRIGLVAQDVEKKHPEAVGLAGGYKTVDYDRATDEAAARAPKAYGGGLSPWHGGSMGGSVFREDAGQGYAVGGAPRGDDILAQINALVNAHQGMFPYGKAGMYGSGMGRAGPYGSTLMQPQSRGLMRAENVGTRPVSAMEGIESTIRRAENIQKMYEGGKKGINFVKEESQLSPTYTTAGQGPTPSGAALGTPTTIRDQLDAFFGGANRGTEIPVAMYRGGLARSNYAMGGLPYSNAEDEYVPEDISKPMQPPKLQTTSTGPMKDQGLEDVKMAMDMAKIAAMFAASDRRLKDNIEPIGKLFDGQKVYRYNLKGDDKKQIGLMAQEVEKRYPDAVGLAPRKGYQPGGEVTAPATGLTLPEGYLDFLSGRESAGRPDATNSLFPPERGGPVGQHQFTARTFLDMARNDPRYEGKSEAEILADRNNPAVSAVYADRYARENAPVLQRAGFDLTRENLALAHMQGATGATALLSNPERSAVDVLTDVYGNRDRAMTVLAQNRGDPNMTSAQFVARLTGSPQPGGAGIVSPQDRQTAGLLPRTQTLQSREPDFLDRNQSWLVPLLTGLGTMASSPSRYLGSAILQGLAGGAQSYAGLGLREQEMALRRGQLAETQQTRELEGRRIGLQERQAGLQAWAAFLQRHQRTVDPRTGQPGWRTETGEFITNDEFSRRQDRILREFGLNLSDISRPSADVSPAGGGQERVGPPAGGPGTTAPGERTGTPPPSGGATTEPAAAPREPTAAGQPAAPGARPPGDVVPAQAPEFVPMDAMPVQARENQQSVDARANRIKELDAIIQRQTRHVQRLADVASPEAPMQQSILQNAIREKHELEGQEQSTASGVRYVIRPGYVEDHRPPAPVTQSPRAEIDPVTGQISRAPVDVGYRGTGGFATPNDVPMNNVQITRAPMIDRARESSGRAADEFLAQSGRSEDAVQNMFRFATALKILEAGGTTMQRAEISNLMRGLGFDRIADTVQRAPDTNAAFVAAKTGIMNAIEVGSQAFPRMTQNEFGTLVSRAVPSADMPPDAVREIMRGQLAASMFTAQFRRDWTAAQEQGVENFNAFSERWRRQHPPGLFMDSADRLLGNLRGQGLPSVDKLTEGVVYVMPRARPGRPLSVQENAISRQFGIGPGELFVVRNLNQVDGRLEFDAQKLPSNVDVFSIYRQAPALRMYGER